MEVGLDLQNNRGKVFDLLVPSLSHSYILSFSVVVLSLDLGDRDSGRCRVYDITKRPINSTDSSSVRLSSPSC